jgi:hypothetical protein
LLIELIGLNGSEATRRLPVTGNFKSQTTSEVNRIKKVEPLLIELRGTDSEVIR